VGDPSVHGGIDKAVHFYPGEHYPLWRGDFAVRGASRTQNLGRLGGFGENLGGGNDRRYACISATVSASAQRWSKSARVGNPAGKSIIISVMKGMLAAVLSATKGGAVDYFSK
jgi:hypothetical protein